MANSKYSEYKKIYEKYGTHKNIFPGEYIMDTQTMSNVTKTSSIPGPGLTKANPKDVFTQYEIDHILSVKENVQNLIYKSAGIVTSEAIVAGGVFVSSFHNETTKDIDYFILSSDKEYHSKIRQFGNSVSWSKKDKKYLHNTNISEVFNHGFSKSQVIFTKYDTRKDLIEDFDYLHCCCNMVNGKLYITKKIYDSIMLKKLIPNNRRTITQWRTDKFLDRGWKIA